MKFQQNLSIFGLTELMRYFATSVVALSVDICVLILLTHAFSINYLLSNVFAFLSGNVVVYFASVRWIFGTRRLVNIPFEWLIFILIGTLGLAVNVATLWMCVDILVWPLLPSKLLAAGFSFLFNFAVRKLVLFN